MAKKTKTAKTTREPIALDLTFAPMDGLGGGFRQPWITAKGEGGFEAGLDSGAGLGNGYLTFWIKPTGRDDIQYFTASMSDLLQRAIDATDGKPAPTLESLVQRGLTVVKNAAGKFVVAGFSDVGEPAPILLVLHDYGEHDTIEAAVAAAQE